MNRSGRGQDGRRDVAGAFEPALDLETGDADLRERVDRVEHALGPARGDAMAGAGPQAELHVLTMQIEVICTGDEVLTGKIVAGSVPADGSFGLIVYGGGTTA